MTWIRRASVATLAATLAIGLTLTNASAVPATPTGDGSSSTVLRPPADGGVGAPLARTLFTTPDGGVSCRRVYTEMVWLECLLRHTNEIVRFGPDESYVVEPCKAPHQSEKCRIGYGAVYIAPATNAQSARFSTARRIPLERTVYLGKRTIPFPECIADPNLGLSCQTAMDDSVGEQIFFGLAGSIWSCPGYESVFDSPIPASSDRCKVIRP